MCFETHHYLQNKFCLRKNYNLLLLDYLAFFLTSKLFFWTFQALLTLVSLLSKSILLTKSACFNLAVTFSAINLLNFWAVIYLAWSSIFFSKMCSSVFICNFYWFMWNKAVASGIFSCKWFTFVFSVLNSVFLTTSLSTTSLNFFKSTGSVFNLPTSRSYTFAFKLNKLVETLTSY